MDRPLSGSKYCRLAVSTAISIGWRGLTADRADTRAVHRDLPPGRTAIDGHPEIEMALVELWSRF